MDQEEAPNTMNKDEGAHFLSHIYDPLLTSSSIRMPSKRDVRSSNLKKNTVRECTKLSGYMYNVKNIKMQLVVKQDVL